MIRLVHPDGSSEIIETYKALQKAISQELDLVEIAPNFSPPVCKILNFKKFKYEQEKKQKEAEKHHKKVHLKEIKFSPNIGEHDYQFKLRHIIEFLKRKDKIKAVVVFHGREITHKYLGENILKRLIADIAKYGKPEKAPITEGKTIYTILQPL